MANSRTHSRFGSPRCAGNGISHSSARHCPPEDSPDGGTAQRPSCKAWLATCGTAGASRGAAAVMAGNSPCRVCHKQSAISRPVNMVDTACMARSCNARIRVAAVPVSAQRRCRRVGVQQLPPRGLQGEQRRLRRLLGGVQGFKEVFKGLILRILPWTQAMWVRAFH